MITPPDWPAPITYGCLHWPCAAFSVRARSLGFWNEARPQLPTISSERMVAGISGATPGSGSGAELDDSDGRLMLLHAASEIVSADAIVRLEIVRALRELIIVFPRVNPWPLPS